MQEIKKSVDEEIGKVIQNYEHMIESANKR